MLHADLGGVLDLLGRATQHFGQRTGGHRAGHADFALAADFGAGDGGVLFVQNADRGGGEQEAHHAVFGRVGHEAGVVVQHGGHDAGGAVGGCSDHAAADGVFFIDGQRVEIDPVERGERVAHAGFGGARQLAVQTGRAAFDLQAAGHDAHLLAAAAHALLHHVPDVEQAGAGLGVGAPGALVFENDLADRNALVAAMRQQRVATVEGVGDAGGVGDDAVGTGRGLVDHETTAHRVIHLLLDQLAGGIEGADAHAVGVVGQGCAPVHDQVLALDEVDGVLAGQQHAPLATDAGELAFDLLDVDHVGRLTFEAEQHGLVTAMAFARGAERAIQLGLDAGHIAQRAVFLEGGREEHRRPHRPHGVGRRRADADLEQVEYADGHGSALRISGRRPGSARTPRRPWRAPRRSRPGCRYRRGCHRSSRPVHSPRQCRSRAW